MIVEFLPFFVVTIEKIAIKNGNKSQFVTTKKAKILNGSQYKVIALLAAGRTLVEAAEEANCSVSSIVKWKRQSEFLLLLEEAKNQLFQAALSEAIYASHRAVRVLVEILEDTDGGSKIRLEAATKLLEFARNSRTLEFPERLQAKIDKTTSFERYDWLESQIED